MTSRFVVDKRGVTLIELMVGLIICGLIVAGIYRIFVAQSRSYAHQDRVVEVQQNIRSAMEIMIRDIRMAAYKNDVTAIVVPTPIFPGDNTLTVRDDAIRVEYESNGNLNAVVYKWDAALSQLQRELFVNGNPDASNPEVLLQNVNGLSFTYGVDGIVGLGDSQDGAIDDSNADGTVDDNDWRVSGATVNGGGLNIIGVRAELTARPAVNPDLPQSTVPRTLVSAVTLRNLCLIK